MKTVSLREITPENWEAILNLSVRDDQKNFMAGNLYSLAEAKVFPEHVPLAIYADEEPGRLASRAAIMYTNIVGILALIHEGIRSCSKPNRSASCWWTTRT